MESRGQPSARAREQDDAFEQDIPPVIACARCGQVDCDGCAPPIAEARLLGDTEDTGMPWEREASLSHLLSSAFLSSEAFDQVFRGRGRTRIGRALSFALLAELLAVASFALPWAAGFFVLFPRMARSMAQSPLMWGFACLVLLGLVLLVVGIHWVWGLVLEWQVSRHTGERHTALGARFGLYACGWDLVTSPAGAVAAWLLYGRAQMFPRLRRAAAAPRASLRYYTETLRGLELSPAKEAIFRSFLLTSLAFLALVLVTLGVLLWSVLVHHVH